jgi:predicted ribosome quality control (RQC) complex YloA/Tae2 family protein
MITNWFTLNKCADYFDQEYASAILDKCITFEKNELWLQFRDKPSLKVHLGQPFQYILQSSQPMKVNKSSIRIFPSLEGAIVDKIEMIPSERIIRMTFSNGSNLYITFLSNRGNIAYVVGDNTELFKKKISVDLPASSKEMNYDSLDDDPRFSPYWKRNAFDIFGVQNYHQLMTIIQASNGNILGNRFVLTPSPDPYDAQIFYRQYRNYVISDLKEDHFESEYKSLEKRISDTLNDLQKHIHHTKDDGRVAKRADNFRYFASILSSCRYMVKDHSESFEIPEMYQHEDFPTLIPLKKEITLAENIDAFYKKARSTENRILEDKQRHVELTTEYAKWEKLYKELIEIKDIRPLRDFQKQHTEMLKKAVKTSTQNDERRPFKEYLKEDWRIWVGRSARDNDELTFKHASKTDLWLHTRHSAGSHVIIKKDGRKDIPKHIVEYAASLAARYSDEKHSSLVTVVTAERKYVTKRKGMPPGKVHFSYEKDLMVKPAEI